MAQKKHRRRRRHDTLILQLLVIVAVVIVIFEGRLIFTMFTHRSSEGQSASGDAAQTELVTEAESQTEGASASKGSHGPYLAGLSDAGTVSEMDTESETSTESYHETVSDPNSSAIVPEQATPVDDSYFADAAFIGDSRMEGFRNSSGITKGTFFTSVGMSLSSMTNDAIISDGTNKMTVAAALSGGSYKKIYIMLGANDLGEYDWNAFKEGLISVTQRFLEIQPDAIIYLCSCIYVEEDKVTTGDYINNANVDKLNSILLDVCEEEGYYYLDLNEIFSDGHGSLIAGASSDGVHMYEKYCKMMLDYLRTHYIEVKDTDKQK